MYSTPSKPGAAMHLFRRRPLLAMTLLGSIALGGMGAASRRTGDPVDVLRADQPAQVQRALENLLGRRSELGLDAGGGFQVRMAFTNTQGQVVARVSQMFGGHRVWGGEAIARVLPGGDIPERDHPPGAR